MAIRVKGRIWKINTSYVLTVPKALVEAGNFEVGQVVTAELEAITGTNPRTLTWVSNHYDRASCAACEAHRGATWRYPIKA